MTCRRLIAYAKERDLPMLCVHAGPETTVRNEGSIRYLSIKRSRLSIPLDHDLKHDPIFLRKFSLIARELEKFNADVFHITGLNDISIAGAILGWKTGKPLIASWHTNLHEFAAQRLKKLLSLAGEELSTRISSSAEELVFKGATQFYRIPKLILAPNQELIDALSKGTGRPARLMSRGVDTEKFSPARRTVNDGILRIGFAGRLRPEKNVELLVDVEKHLIDSGIENFRFLIVGEGSQRSMLEKNLQFADFTGFIDKEDLSEAFANMDVFLFPSETDAFGNVVQEALASGVPSIVTDKGGPKFIIEHGVTGFIASDKGDFLRRLAELVRNPAQLEEMKAASRQAALGRIWEAIFDGVFDAYCHVAEMQTNQTAGSDPNTPASPSFRRNDLRTVAKKLLSHPVNEVLLRWNWKSAILSALLRSPIFFAAYLAQKQGLWIATGAMLVQFAFRTFFGGVNGAILQSFSKVTPAWHAVITVPIFLAAISHLLEFVIQSAFDSVTGSQGKGGAVLFSASVSVLSAVFNLFAMRRGVLLVRDESSQSLWRDLKQMPFIAFEFLSFPLVWTWKRSRRA